MNTPTIIGFFEAVTESHVLGWAWSPALPDEALLVELRLGEQVIAHGRADRLREDLRTNGVGDGRHAFELPIEEAYRERAAEITVQACRADGVIVPLPPAPAPAADIPPAGIEARLDSMQGMLGQLVGSQRVLHRNLQSLLLSAHGEPKAPDPTLADLLGRLGTLETHLMRLDEHLAKLSQAPAAPHGRARVLVPLAGLLLTAAVGSAYALARALAG
jgi:hypothetical protein